MMLDTAFVDREVLGAVAVLITGLVGAYQHYRKTGRIPLGNLPWNAIRKTVYEARALFFTTDYTPEKNRLNVSVEVAKEHFATRGYEIDWPFSYHYHGEDENLRRYYYNPEKEHPHRQMHVRLFEADDGTALVYGHDEPSALHHPKAHLSDKYVIEATDWVSKEYQKIAPESDALDPVKFSRE